MRESLTLLFGGIKLLALLALLGVLGCTAAVGYVIFR